MRGLSLHQPWATLVAIGAKTIETRSWRVDYRGWLAIQATKGFPDDAIAECHREPFKRHLKAAGIVMPADLPRGAIVAVVNLHRVGRIGRRRDDAIYVEGQDLPVTGDEFAFGNYTPDRFGWILDDVQVLAEPVPCRGYQSLWDVPAEIEAEITRQIGAPA